MDSNPTQTVEKRQAPLLDGEVILPDAPADSPSIRKDFVDDSMFGVDDMVVLLNILDGKTHNGYKMPKAPYVFTYNGVQYRVQPGQKFTLPGARAYLYVKHLVSLIYRRIENKPEMDKRSYPQTDKWVKEMVVQINKTLSAHVEDRDQVHDIPNYQAEDEAVQKATGLPGHLANAASQAGSGEHELRQVDTREPELTDDDLDKIPDFDERTAPQFKDEDGNVVKPEVPAKKQDRFPDAKKNKGARQPQQ